MLVLLTLGAACLLLAICGGAGRLLIRMGADREHIGVMQAFVPLAWPLLALGAVLSAVALLVAVL